MYVGIDQANDNNPNPYQSIMSIRYDGGQLPTASVLVWGPDSGERSHPVWSQYGSTIYFAQRSNPSQAWNIGYASSAAGWQSYTLSSVSGVDLTSPDAGPTGVVAAQSQADNGSGTPTGMPSVVQINVQTGGTTTIVDNASQPSVAPDGKHVAFVRSDGTWDQVYTSDLSGGNVTQVTADAATHSVPTWSPDGTTIAFDETGIHHRPELAGRALRRRALRHHLRAVVAVRRDRQPGPPSQVGAELPVRLDQHGPDLRSRSAGVERRPGRRRDQRSGWLRPNRVGPALPQSVKSTRATTKSSQLKLLANTAKSTAHHHK